MSDASHDQTLAEFQEYTGLENIEECISFLQKHNWNLMNAVHALYDQINSGSSTITQPNGARHTTATSSPPSSRAPTTQRRTTTTQVQPSSVVKKPTPASSTFVRPTRTSGDNESDESRHIRSVHATGTRATNRGTVRELHFIVEYKDQTERFSVVDTDTVHKLQVKIYERLNIPVSRQKFTNWADKHYDAHTVLRDLHLPRENTIHLISSSSTVTTGTARSTTTSTHATNRTHRQTTSPSEKIAVAATPDLSVTILCEDRSGQRTPYELQLTPKMTIGEIKKEIERTARIPLQLQSWTGLNNAKDSDEFSRTGISRRDQLAVRRAEPAAMSHTSTTRRDVKHSTLRRHTSDNDSMDYDDPTDQTHFDDDVSMVPGRASSSTTANGPSDRELLIPERCANEAAGLENFSRVFRARYNATGPLVIARTLDEAIQESFNASIHEKRPLAIYVHNDQSICANVFCSQVLASDTIVEYLDNNFVVWAWDITAVTNRSRLLETLKRCLGPMYAQRLAFMETESFPLILCFNRSHGSIELLEIIEGKSTAHEVLIQLMKAQEEFSQQRQRDAKEESMREVRENLKRQQEDEYIQSLQVDRAKEEARLVEERKQKEEQRAAEKSKQERLNEQERCKARLPAEPHEAEQDITRFKIRLPNDDGVLLRRFRVRETLQTLFDYLSTQGRMFGDYKLLTTYPRRDLTSLNRADTFEQLKLFPQEQLFLEPL